ncbi:MAG: TIGR02281 family clan AA aspartic protease [Hyphomicrobiales bacterium]|nr:TIGR02281 family clan AA aspartic protease [Hyphomicrobiales bacterium]
MKVLLVVAAIAVAILLLVMFGDSRVAGDVPFGRVVQSMMYGTIAVSMASYLVLQYRGKLGTAVLSAIAWVAIFGLAVVGYTYRNDLEVVANRVMDEVVPGRKVVSEPGQAVAVRSRNGHFFLDGITNGRVLRYMFDTGASAVVLSAKDARKIGLTPDKLKYTTRVSTANGSTMAAPVRIDALTFGGITLRDVRAMVAAPGALRENLLGMSYLGRLTSYTVRNNRLVLVR